MNTQVIPNTAVTGLACRMAHEREQEAMPSAVRSTTMLAFGNAGGERKREATIAQWRREQGITLTRRKSGSNSESDPRRLHCWTTRWRLY